ncbi:MinD/ParA family ATP-binding protein [Falsiroseomonas selenitidurans]|uniref:MinD/ParA family protein n=1 Tax=Falsiroseomonas selenitidurans TaxID=2716335 RepID=A0ABX1E1N4_9PROT|nr:MinD/ParA family protein [Falsiroseomonas selenitidurans]NKC31066.1 MinD/ParA family protein [Falsiroseomonas selenitidurans]
MIVSTHSYRGGTGKSNITANLAALLARSGRRVGVVDTDIQSPGIHVLFQLEPQAMRHTLNDVLWGRCAMTDAAHDVTDRVAAHGKLAEGGAVFLIPSSVKAGEITRILREGFDVNLLGDAYNTALDALGLDVLMIDTHPGMSEETLLSIAVSDTLLLVLRPDSQDYQGTAVTLEVARRLDVPNLLLVVNKSLSSLDFALLKDRMERTYSAPVAGILPFSEEMLTLGSADLFALTHPAHAFAAGLRDVMSRL